MPDDLKTLYSRAVRHHQNGNPQSAAELYRTVLAAQPENYDALYLLGTAQLQLGRFNECIDTLRQVSHARPDIPDVHNNLGIAYQASGRWEEAARSYQQAIKLHPEYDQAFFNLGALMESRALWSDAEKCYRHALELKPTDLKAQTGLANVLRSLERWSEAEAAYRQAIDSADNTNDQIELNVQLAYVLAKQERLNDAAAIYDQIVDQHPDYREIHQVHNSLSYIRERQGHIDEAIESARRAIELVPKFAEGFNNLGIALRSHHRLDEARKAFRQALSLRPNFPLAEFNLGTTELLTGNYRGGWAGYEKHSALNSAAERQFDRPEWRGEPIAGKTLLIYSDQGFGDAIQFARFLPRLRREHGCKVVFECPPELLPLFANQLEIDSVVAEGTPLPAFDWQLPLASVPGRLNVDLTSVGAENAYLTAPSTLRPELRHSLHTAVDNLLKVGVAWQGNPKQARNVVRSCPFKALMPLLSIEGTQWFSLQTGEDRFEQLVKLTLAHRPVDVADELRDFADTAAVMSRLDLILTVDTATAHLAGALGRPVWTILCHTPDWRWLLDRTDSPWYPTMRLFRQPTWGDWDAIVSEVGNELRKLASRQN